jgi:hypothetical protein
VYELVHPATATKFGPVDTARDALDAFDRIRLENPQLASELALVTPDEADVVAHVALEYGQ